MPRKTTIVYICFCGALINTAAELDYLTSIQLQQSRESISRLSFFKLLHLLGCEIGLLKKTWLIEQFFKNFRNALDNRGLWEYN